MEIEAQEATKTRKLVFHRVAENLYRLDGNGGYYALLKRGDKQFRRSLKTKDRKLAERRLSDLRAQVGQLRITTEANETFDKIAERWMAAMQHTLKAATIVRRRTCLKNLSPHFRNLTIRNIQAHHCEAWVTARANKIAAQTMAHELNAMRAVFDYAVRLGLMLSNPAKDIQRKKVTLQPIAIPTREQFKNLIAAIRPSDGRADSQAKAQPGADLVELMAYSGCRLGEATSLQWRDVNFERNTVTITGGEVGTKSNEHRTIPMTAAFSALLRHLHDARQPKPDEFVSMYDSAKKCLQTACRRLNYPQFTHHDFRHFFATTCIEAGVDIPTVSRWLGHKDGGALAMKVYGHLRHDHSMAAASRVQF